MENTALIDSRPVYGWGGSVQLEARPIAGSKYAIAILDPQGETLWERGEDSLASAYSAWTHPFSFADAPNPFARTPDDDDSDDDDSDVVERIADYTAN